MGIKMNGRYRNYKKALGVMINAIRRNGHKYTDCPRCTFSYRDKRSEHIITTIISLSH